MYTSCTLRKDTQENWVVTSPNGPSYHLKYHLQIKKKDLEVVGFGEGQYGKLVGKAEWTRTRLLCRFKSLPSALIRMFRVILLFPLQKGRHSLKNGDFLYIWRYLFQKGNFYLVFRASPVSGKWLTLNKPWGLFIIPPPQNLRREILQREVGKEQG